MPNELKNLAHTAYIMQSVFYGEWKICNIKPYKYPLLILSRIKHCVFTEKVKVSEIY